jgi:hypothetical protein
VVLVVAQAMLVLLWSRQGSGRGSAPSSDAAATIRVVV